MHITLRMTTELDRDGSSFPVMYFRWVVICFCVYEMLSVEVVRCSSQEFEREKHAHSVLQFQFSEMKEMLKQSEELLNVSICPPV